MCSGTNASIQYTLGLVTDRDYRITAQQHDFLIDRVRGDDLMRFPIEKARLRSMKMSVLVSVLTCLSTRYIGTDALSDMFLSVPRQALLMAGL